MARVKNFYHDELEARRARDDAGWSGYPHPDAPDSFWIDDETGEAVSAYSGVRLPAGTPVADDYDFSQDFGGKSI